jgi:hypothetical protein
MRRYDADPHLPFLSQSYRRKLAGRIRRSSRHFQPTPLRAIAIRPAACKRLDLPQSVSSGVYGAQKLHDLVTDFGRGFVLNPVAHIVDFEMSHETRKAGAEFFEGWIELP